MPNSPNLNRQVSTFIGNLVTKLMILSLGLVFLLPAAYKSYTYYEFRRHAVSVDGIITKSSRGGDIGGRPFVEYKDLQGKSYGIKSRAKTHWFFAPRVGEKLSVYYDKNDPNNAIVDSVFYYILLPIGFMAVGVGVIFYVIRDSIPKIAPTRK
jgi:hypothetical protein